jgi:molybdate transport system substrate-binding protein
MRTGHLKGRAVRAAILQALVTTFIAILCLVPAQARDIVMFAAASTTDALNEVGKAYQAAGHGRVALSFASSSTLAKQIESGAPADLYLSADGRWMDYLAKRNLVVSASRIDFLGNTLVLIAPRDSKLSLEIAPGFPLAAALGPDGRLAIGDPDHVPAGIYGKAALEKLGVWQQVLPRLARASDVRAALAFVERGETPAGVVYGTDAARARVRVVASFPEGSYPKIAYPLALVAGHDSPAARAFYDYLRGPAARAVFARYGFAVH